MRLEEHLGKTKEILGSSGRTGRHLEFISQEMHREANTIGAKASDIEIDRQVLEVKTAIDRLREQVENVQ